MCERPGTLPPSWVRTLQGRVPNVCIDILQESIIADFSPGLRAGAFIDLTGKTAWVEHVPCMIRAKLPVYVCWNTNPSGALTRYPFLRPYLPPTTSIPIVIEQSLNRLRFRWSTKSDIVSAPSQRHREYQLFIIMCPRKLRFFLLLSQYDAHNRVTEAEAAPRNWTKTRRGTREVFRKARCLRW